MGNLQAMDVAPLSNSEMALTTGGLPGLIMVSMRSAIEFYNWAYVEFKNGLHDGYNGK